MTPTCRSSCLGMLPEHPTTVRQEPVSFFALVEEGLNGRAGETQDHRAGTKSSITLALASAGNRQSVYSEAQIAFASA